MRIDYFFQSCMEGLKILEKDIRADGGPCATEIQPVNRTYVHEYLSLIPNFFIHVWRPNPLEFCQQNFHEAQKIYVLRFRLSMGLAPCSTNSEVLTSVTGTSSRVEFASLDCETSSSVVLQGER